MNNMLMEERFPSCCTAKVAIGFRGNYAGYLGYSGDQKKETLTEEQMNDPRIKAAVQQQFQDLLDFGKGRGSGNSHFEDFKDCSLLVAITTAIQEVGADCLRDVGFTSVYTGTKDQKEQREKYTGGLTLWCIEPKDFVAWKARFRAEQKAEKVEVRKARFSAPTEVAPPVAVPEEVVPVAVATPDVQPVVEAPARIPSFTIRNLVALGYLPETIPGATPYSATMLFTQGIEARRRCAAAFGVTPGDWTSAFARNSHGGGTLRGFNELMRARQAELGVR